jgi:urease accessory protein
MVTLMTTGTGMGMGMGTGTGTGMGMITGIGMDTRTAMDTAITATDPAAWSRLLAWMSPSFPTGAFSYSHGLETAVEDGAVHDAATLCAYVGTVLAHGAMRTDAALLALAWRAQARDDKEGLAGIAELAAAMRGSAELALESHAQGQAFLSTVRAAWSHARLDAVAELLAARDIAVASPIAVAVAGAVWEIPLDALLLAHLHAVAANLVSAGVRLVPLGQTDGQRVIAALEEPIRIAAHHAADVTDADTVYAAAPVIDLLSIRHETQYTRLFRS